MTDSEEDDDDSWSIELVTAYPTTPPAGPDRMALLPRKVLMGVSPPSDCMKLTFTADRPESNPLEKECRYFLITGVRYASTQVVPPLGTARIIGITSDEILTCSKPISRASAFTCTS